MALLLPRAIALAIPISALIAPDCANALGEFVFSSNFESAPDCSSVGLPGCPGFAIETPQLVVQPGARIDACYYFRTPNAGVSAIGRFSSIFNPTVAHFIVWSTTDPSTGLPADAKPPGTFDTNCGLSVGSNGRNFRWIYAAHLPIEQLRMPDDDGAAQPLAFELPASSAGFLEIYYENTGASPVTVAPVLLRANERPAGPYTRTATYLELNPFISIPPDNAPHTVSGSCSVPTNFWWFSTQTHAHATATQLSRTGAVTSTILNSSDWTLPAIATYAAPFFQFGASDKLTYTCTYVNNTGQTITFGGDYQSDEVCMGIAYFFPATQSQFCLGDTPQ